MTAGSPAVGVTLRPVTDADRPFLLVVYAHTRVPELAAVPWTDEQKAAFCAHQFAAQDADYRGRWPDGRFLVVEVGGVPAGRLYVGETDTELRVMDVTLLPVFRGRGIGAALLRDVLAEAQRTGRCVVLHVEHFNPARRLYERLGFAETDRDDVYARMEWRPAG